MPAVSSISPSGISYIDYVESGLKWASGNFTYSFPASASFYIGYGGGAYGDGEQNNGFKAFTAAQQAATTSILNMYAQVANVTFSLITETSTQSATLRYAESNLPSTAWGYYPSISPEGGDAWFNNSTHWYDNPVLGNYAYLTIIHETGHLLGLKHAHEASGSFPAAPVSADSLEYTVMSYRSYIGASTTQGLTNGTWSFPQTLMMYDIAALQNMYGANYSTNNSDTVYKWNPTTGQETINGVAQAAPGGNKIFQTVWDGGGNDTYDFSSYTTNVTVSLQPGVWTTTSTAQLANLGAGHNAIGNIANAYLFNNNTASLIENAVGGTGNDSLTGNTANNKLTGGAGNDTLDGVSGSDTAVYSGASSNYQVTQNADGSWKVVDLRSGSPDGTDTLKNIDFLQFSDTTVAVGAVPPPPPPPVTIESFGSTSLTQVGNQYYLYDSSGAGPTLKMGGASVAVDQFKGWGWSAIGAEKTATGYLVAWQVTGTDQFGTWTTDNNGNCVSSAMMLGSSNELKTAEPLFQQDLNGDGVIGGGTVIESNGVTSLTQIGANYYLCDSSGAGPTLKMGGASIIVDQFKGWGWSAISAEKTATGYEIAWQVTGTDQFGTWTTDNNGNKLSSTMMLGSSTELKTAEPLFHQDLNGDGVIGAGTVIESNGVTSLTQIGASYYLCDSSGAGPTLKMGGASIVVDQFQGWGWSAIGAEKTATGYLVAWKATGTDQYGTWTTDNNGNYLSSTTMLGSSTELKTAEPLFNQDLNGDGVIGGAGPTPATIVSGTAGNDVLTSTAANEVLFGNGGHDTFVFAGNFGKDTVADFHAETDVLAFSREVFADAADVLAHAAQTGVDVTVTVDTSHTVTLSDTTLAQLNPYNFHLI